MRNVKQQVTHVRNVRTAVLHAFLRHFFLPSWRWSHG